MLNVLDREFGEVAVALLEVLKNTGVENET
jgi:hypothetical protein